MPCSHCPWPPLIAIWGRISLPAPVLGCSKVTFCSLQTSWKVVERSPVLFGEASLPLFSIRRILSAAQGSSSWFCPEFSLSGRGSLREPQECRFPGQEGKERGDWPCGGSSLWGCHEIASKQRPCFSQEAQPSRPVPSLSVSFVWMGNWCLLTTLRSRWTKTGKSLTPGLRRLAAGQQSLQVLWRLSG